VKTLNLILPIPDSTRSILGRFRKVLSVYMPVAVSVPFIELSFLRNSRTSLIIWVHILKIPTFNDTNMAAVSTSGKEATQSQSMWKLDYLSLEKYPHTSNDSRTICLAQNPKHICTC
jgi:hypothetical protein